MAAPRHSHGPSHRLARMDLVLAPGRGAGARVRAVLLALLAVAAAAGGGWWVGMQGAGAGVLRLAASAAPSETPPGDTAPSLAPSLEQARVALQVAQARGQELERQIDALNQRLHQCQEELMFFRKASGKRTH